jgi:ketosteroid isomerase-like protein
MASSRNLELVRSIFAAWERGDWGSGDWAHDEIEYVVPDGAETGTWRGLAAAAEAGRDRMSVWEGFRVEAEEYRELDSERVLVLVRQIGRGKMSGVELGEIRAKGAHLFHIRDGRVTRLVQYNLREHALADLGLAPEDGSP